MEPVALLQIVKKVACLICQAVPETKSKQPPKVPLLVMAGNKVEEEIKELKVRKMYPVLLDGTQLYHYTDSGGWAEIFNYIYCVFDMPKYVAGRMDCEDFGILLKGLVSALFGLNYFAFTVGESPMGMHGYNFFRTGNGLLILEPQTAEYFEWGTKGYKPQWVLI